MKKWLEILAGLAVLLPWLSPPQRLKAKKIKLQNLKDEKTRLTTRTRPSEARVKKLLKIEKQIKAIERDLLNTGG